MVLEALVHAVMRDRCSKYTSMPDACAEFNFSAARCDIWFSSDFPPSQFVIEHERAHCLGFDHVGSNEMQAMFSKYLEAL